MPAAAEADQIAAGAGARDLADKSRLEIEQ
jgi:hypothetical protein